MSCVGIEGMLRRPLQRNALHRDTREFSQIGNVDVGVNVDVEYHPVGSSTPQNFQFQGKE